MKIAAPVIAIWTPKRVAAAVSHGAEIYQSGGMYFLLSGLVGDDASGFDARAIIEAVLDDGSFKEKVAAAQGALEEPLAVAAQRINDTRPEDFKKYLASRKALEAIFFGIHSGAPALAYLAFATKKKGKDVVFKAELNEYPNARTDMMTIEPVTAGLVGDAGQFFRNGVTGQQALVYPLKVLQKFMALAGTAFPVTALRLTSAGTATASVESADASVADFPEA